MLTLAHGLTRVAAFSRRNDQLFFVLFLCQAFVAAAFSPAEYAAMMRATPLFG